MSKNFKTDDSYARRVRYLTRHICFDIRASTVFILTVSISDLRPFLTFVVGVTEGAVEFVAADSNVGAARPAAQGNVTDAAAEALEVVEQLQRLDHHRSPAT